jgi:hypothetical protein
VTAVEIAVISEWTLPHDSHRTSYSSVLSPRSTNRYSLNAMQRGHRVRPLSIGMAGVPSPNYVVAVIPTPGRAKSSRSRRQCPYTRTTALGREGKDPLGVAHVQAFDHATVHRYNALPRCLSLLVGRDDLAGVG